MKKVITFGVFDYFHYGHLRLFNRAKAFGDYLIVAVQNGDCIFKTKPNAHILYTTEQRIELINALKVVDKTIVYDDVDKTIKTVDFEVFVVGEDQTHSGFKRAIEWCNNNNKEVVVLSRTPGICSSDIKKNLSH